MATKTNKFPPQHQKKQPGRQDLMVPRPETVPSSYRAAGKLEGKVALITGGDSGIGRSIAVLFAKEGADIAIVYLNEHKDAKETDRLVKSEGRRCILIEGDIGNEAFCRKAVRKTVDKLQRVDILVNNAAVQFAQDSIEDISGKQLEKTFRTNIFSQFFLSKAAIPHLRKGSSILNTASITAYEGNVKLMDYAATKGAIVTFTRSLAKSLVDRAIRVNAVAPGPIWTPLIPASFDKKKVSQFGSDTPMKRAGQPSEVAPAYVFLASEDATYITGQIIHINGGDFVTS